MNRIEIICDATIEDELKKSLHAIGDELYYTSSSPVGGRGIKGLRQGDAVWPEENALFVLYTDEGGSEQVRRAVEDVRRRFPRNGLAAFSLQSAVAW